MLPLDDDETSPMQVVQEQEQKQEQERARGLTGNLCDAENALRDGRYNTPRAPTQARGLFAAMGVTPDTEARSEQALADRYRMPPFSILNARDGAWQDRKRKWIALGIKSELGRGNTVTEQDAEMVRAGRIEQHSLNTSTVSDDDDDLVPALLTEKSPRKMRQRTEPDGRAIVGLTGLNQKLGVIKDDKWLTEQSGTSIFDPVLTECCYLWYSSRGSMVLDPFAGGSVRGIVAAMLGRRYYGVDLRAEQIAANEMQAERILPRFPDAVYPAWRTDDSRNIALHGHTAHGPFADYIFTCPPYADLEVYSDDPRDISTLSYADFRTAYFEIITAACSLLKQDRFATCVIGECRSKEDGGPYYGFVPDTIRAFEAAGLRFYNEQILITMVGSLPLRAGMAFDAARKCGKTHQNVLTFVKGDPRRATEACGVVDTSQDPLVPARNLR